MVIGICSSQSDDMKNSIAHAERSAIAAQTSAEVATQALIEGNRAWLKVDVTVSDQPLIQLNGIHGTAIKIAIENAGNAPALFVTRHAKLIIGSSGVDPLAEQTQFCMEVNEKSKYGGFIMFPGEINPKPNGIVEHTAVHTRAEDIERQNADTRYPHHGGELIVIGCVDYRVASDASRRHQTRFMYVIRSRIKRKPLLTDDGPTEEAFSFYLEEFSFGVGQSAD